MLNYSDIWMDKAAQTQYPIYDLLRQRSSSLVFSARMVEPEKLHSVWEAASWAAASYNEQPGSFIGTSLLIQDYRFFFLLSDLSMQSNQDAF